MKKYIFLFLSFQLNLYAQISNFSEVFELPSEVEETSGLLFLNNRIITHNDSGGEAKLYEIDNNSGLIVRVVTIQNAVNVDWEGITQDQNHIYIADIGNNNGNRQDLKIYKILKTDYLSMNTVTADVILFSYEDQVNFTSQPNSHNFDAEAVVVYDGQLLIFTKNWLDFTTNVYAVSVDVGNHTAVKVSSYNTQGLITDANYNTADDSFMLTGYDASLVPFLVYIDGSRDSGNDIFNADAQKILLMQELGPGNQVEGITNFSDTEYYISRERFSTVFNGSQVIVPQKLFKFLNTQSALLSTSKEIFDSMIVVSPNPSSNNLSVAVKEVTEKLFEVNLYNALGVKMKQTTSAQINIKDLPMGLYYIEVVLQSKKRTVKKFIKI